MHSSALHEANFEEGGKHLLCMTTFDSTYGMPMET